MTKIFLSYASEDRIMVESMARQLKLAGHTIWMDIESIKGGSKWKEEIISALEQAEVCVLVITQNSVVSDWVKREIVMARNLKKTIIPIVMYQMPTITTLDRFDVSDLQIIDFHRYGFSIGFDKLLNALSAPISFNKSSFKALIIEDMRDQQQMIEKVLHTMYISCTIADNYDTAFDYIRRETYDLITLDMQLGEMDTGGQHGMLLLDQLKSLEHDTKVIIISALDWTGEQVRDFLLKYKADDYIKKPSNLVELRQRIINVIGER